MNFIKVFIYYLKKKYGYLSQEFGDSEMQKVQQRVQDQYGNTHLHTVSDGKTLKVYKSFESFSKGEKEIKPIFPSYEGTEKTVKAFVEEEKSKESETGKVSKRPRRSVQSMDTPQVRKERISKVRNLHSPKASEGDAKRTLRQPSTQSNKVGRRKLPPSVRGL